jgi:hypothetical protein
MALYGAEDWIAKRMEGLEDQPLLTLCELTNQLLNIQSEVEATIRLSCGRAHKNCTPWTEEDLFDFNVLPEFRSLLFRRQEYMRKQAEEAGFDTDFNWSHD